MSLVHFNALANDAFYQRDVINFYWLRPLSKKPFGSWDWPPSVLSLSLSLSLDSHTHTYSPTLVYTNPCDTYILARLSLLLSYSHTLTPTATHTNTHVHTHTRKYTHTWVHTRTCSLSISALPFYCQTETLSSLFYFLATVVCWSDGIKRFWISFLMFGCRGYKTSFLCFRSLTLKAIQKLNIVFSIIKLSVAET